MTDKKITDKELKQEIRKGKTEKEIAYDNGYGYPSQTLNERIRNLGYEKNQKISLTSNNAGQFYISGDCMENLAEQKNLDVEKTEKVFFKIDTEKLGDGKAELEITEDSFKEVEQ